MPLKSVVHLEYCSRKFPESFKKVSRVFQGSSKGVQSKIKRCFKGFFSVFQRSLKDEGSLKSDMILISKFFTRQR